MTRAVDSLLIAMVIAVLLAAPAAAAAKKPHASQQQRLPAAVVEPDGKIDERLDAKWLAAAVFAIRANGYVCDTVRYAYPFIFGVGAHVTCNRGLYRYEVTIPGGQLLITAK